MAEDQKTPTHLAVSATLTFTWFVENRASEVKALCDTAEDVFAKQLHQVKLFAAIMAYAASQKLNLPQHEAEARMTPAKIELATSVAAAEATEVRNLMAMADQHVHPTDDGGFDMFTPTVGRA